VAFDARGPGNEAVYHTNVLMAIGAHFAVLCPDAIPDRVKRDLAPIIGKYIK